MAWVFITIAEGYRKGSKRTRQGSAALDRNDHNIADAASLTTEVPRFGPMANIAPGRALAAWPRDGSNRPTNYWTIEPEEEGSKAAGSSSAGRNPVKSIIKASRPPLIFCAKLVESSTKAHHRVMFTSSG